MAKPALPHLAVSPSVALAHLRAIPHARCQSAIENHWHVDGKKVRPQSICWLYCWAKTGMGSEAAAGEARRVFDEILSLGFSAFAARVPHDWARKARYSSEDISLALAGHLRS